MLFKIYIFLKIYSTIKINQRKSKEEPLPEYLQFPVKINFSFHFASRVPLIIEA